MKSDFSNWSDVRVFLAVVRKGSTLAASKGLGMAQPTVARRIEALEHGLGLSLFERDTRGFQPTPDALALVPVAEAMETSATKMADEARKLRSPETPIRVTAAVLNFGPTFKTVFAEFKEQHPQTRFEFIATDRPLDLSAGEADVAIRHGREFNEKDLICRKLSEGSFALYASPEYIEEHGRPASGDELQGHAIVAVDGDEMPSQLRKWVANQINPTQVTMTCTDWASMLTAVQTGVGIGPIATSLGDTTEGLVRCADLPESTSYLTMLLVNPLAYRRKEVKAFTAFFAPRYAALARAEKTSAR